MDRLEEVLLTRRHRFRSHRWLAHGRQRLVSVQHLMDGSELVGCPLVDQLGSRFAGGAVLHTGPRCPTALSLASGESEVGEQRTRVRCNPLVLARMFRSLLA